jgi:hypothetical protein
MQLDLTVDQSLNGVLALIRLYGLPPDTLLLGFTLVSNSSVTPGTTRSL